MIVIRQLLVPYPDEPHWRNLRSFFSLLSAESMVGSCRYCEFCKDSRMALLRPDPPSARESAALRPAPAEPIRARRDFRRVKVRANKQRVYSVFGFRLSSAFPPLR